MLDGSSSMFQSVLSESLEFGSTYKRSLDKPFVCVQISEICAAVTHLGGPQCALIGPCQGKRELQTAQPLSYVSRRRTLTNKHLITRLGSYCRPSSNLLVFVKRVWVPWLAHCKHNHLRRLHRIRSS